MFEPGATTNIIAGTVALLVLKETGLLIKGVIASLRKNGTQRGLPVCVPSPAVLERLAGISSIQERTVECLGRIEQDLRENRGQLGAIRGDLGNVKTQLNNLSQKGG